MRRIDALAEVRRLKPGVTVTDKAANTLLNERVGPIAEAVQRYGKGLPTRMTFAAVAARSEKWGWFVAAARRMSGNTNQRGHRMLVAGPFATKKLATQRARELRNGRCIVHDDCCGCEEMAKDCLRATLKVAGLVWAS